jgi:transcriptional regulator with XRE-family HTH domain
MSIPLNKLLGVSYTNYVNKIGAFFESSFLNWQSKFGKRKTLNEFAEHLDITPSLLSMWLSGDRKPGRDNIEKISELLGPEIYDAMDLPRPDPRLVYITRNWDKFSEEGRRKISDEATHYGPDAEKENI